MKKGIFTSLFVLTLAFSGQVYSYQYLNGSTFVFSDLLIWRLREGSAENWAQVITIPKGISQSAKLVDAPFKWNAGIRAGIGYNHCNGWDAVLYYTGYQTTGTNHATGSVFSAFLGNFFANNTNGQNFGPFYHDASIDWKFYFNTVDLEFGHTFKIDQRLNLRPFLGIKTAIINQDIHTHWHQPSTTILGIPIPITTFSSATENLKNDFWGIGPSIGLNTTWPIYKVSKGSFNIFGNVSGALLWGYWKFKDVYRNNTPASIAINLNNINGAATMARGMLGIEWASYFSKTSINIRLSYEAQVWFNQMQYYSFNMGRLNNLMSLQGGVLDFCFNI